MTVRDRLCAASSRRPRRRGGRGAVRAVRDAGAAASTRTSCRWRSGGCSARAGRAGSCSTTRGAGGGGYRAVPDRYLVDPGVHRCTDAAVGRAADPGRHGVLPAQLGARTRIVACYPSPAGATESELSLDAWANGRRREPARRRAAPDVEALLVRREPRDVPAGADRRLLPAGRAGALHWRGFDGGSEAWAAIDGFFAELPSPAASARRD